MKKILSIFLVFLFSVGVLSGCGGTDTSENTGSTAVGQETSDFSTDDVIYIENGSPRYTIIRPDDSELTVTASSVFKYMKDKLNVSVKNSMDTASDGTDEYEILIGNTNRPESKQAYDWLIANVGGRYDDYIICTINKKIVIQAITNDGLQLAAKYFTDNFVKLDGIKGGIHYFNKTEGTFQELTVNGETFAKFSFVRPHFNSSYLTQVEMEKVASDVHSTAGFVTEILEDSYASEGDFEIVVGNTNRSEVNKNLTHPDEYEIKISGKKIYLNGGSPHATAIAVSEFGKLLSSKKTLTDADSISGGYSETINEYDASVTYRPIWGDYFDGDDVDTAKWYVQPKTANGREGQNGKFSGMDPNAVFVREGKLYIVAHENNDGYWGGEIITQKHMQYKYGYIEYSCIQADGDGFWSLLWLCGEGGAARPEIDVNECFGNASATAANCHSWPTAIGEAQYGWQHTSLDGNNKHAAKKYYCPDGKHFGEDFHTFGFLWDEDEMTFTADGKVFFSYTTNTTEQDIDSFVDDYMYVRIGMSFGRLNNNLKVENLTDWERENTNKFIVDWIQLYRLEGQGDFKLLK